MNRYEFLESLDKLLSSLPYDQRREIMYDYEEHFREALSEGILEETIINTLGIPEKIASQYTTALVPLEPSNVEVTDIKEKTNSIPKPNETSQSKPKQVGNSSSERFALSVVLLLFNCFFLVWIYIAHWSVLIGFVVTGLALVVAGFAAMISAIVAVPFLSIPVAFVQAPILLFTASIALICIGGLMLIVLYYIIHFTCYLTGKYVKWNLHVIRGY